MIRIPTDDAINQFININFKKSQIIQKMKNSKSEKKEAGVIYTCSMHPEVRSDKPGKCPKCGMTLIEKK
ncbi:MAG TPA: hypothetical protein DCR40_20465 [Prolixibacteraceae bacterium]|nr:hypothetical protein [Prolixibacteraceae bacterium]